MCSQVKEKCDCSIKQLRRQLENLEYLERFASREERIEWFMKNKDKLNTSQEVNNNSNETLILSNEKSSSNKTIINFIPEKFVGYSQFYIENSDNCNGKHLNIDEELRISISKNLSLEKNKLTFDEFLPFIVKKLEFQKIKFNIHLVENLTFIVEYLFFNNYKKKLILDFFNIKSEGMNIQNVCSNFKHLEQYNSFYLSEYLTLENVFTNESLKTFFITKFQNRFSDEVNLDVVWNFIEKTFILLEKSTNTQNKIKSFETIIRNLDVYKTKKINDKILLKKNDSFIKNDVNYLFNKIES